MTDIPKEVLEAATKVVRQVLERASAHSIYQCWHYSFIGSGCQTPDKCHCKEAAKAALSVVGEVK